MGRFEDGEEKKEKRERFAGNLGLSAAPWGISSLRSRAASIHTNYTILPCGSGMENPARWPDVPLPTKPFKWHEKVRISTGKYKEGTRRDMGFVTGCHLLTLPYFDIGLRTIILPLEIMQANGFAGLY